MTCLGFSPEVVRADEGMWLLNNPPVARLQRDHQFQASPAWLEHVQKSAVRFSTGGSGSMVSSTGLVLTNHHVISDMLVKLSTPERDLMKEGFLARTPGEELACPDLELNILWAIEDVTQRVNDAAGAAGTDSAAIGAARRKAMAEIESHAENATGLKCEIVTLYQGARYHLYQYKKFTDVRFVFAPPLNVAFFGGDTDNFEFPRYNLDCALLRVYEHGKAVTPEHHLAWSTGGVNEHDLVCVIGHPGRTHRAYTLDHFKFMRDFDTPRRLDRYYRTEINLLSFAGRSTESARIAQEDLFGYANARKATIGLMSGLADPAVLKLKAQAERELIAAAQASGDPRRVESLNKAMAALASALEEYKTYGKRYELLNLAPARAGELLGRAVHLARLAEELPKPSAERLREYGDARLESLKDGLFSPAPVYDSFETFRIEQFLLALVEQLGGEDPVTVKALAGKSPRDRAHELVSGCTFKNVDARKMMFEGGASALDAANDPIISLVRGFDAEARTLRTRYESQMDSVERSSYAVIAAERFASLGESVYPDATFTLRLSYGTVKGWNEGGQQVPAFTTMRGLFERYDQRHGEPGFDLSPQWLDAKSRIALDTPFNFVCTPDIIGGNSGSPVVNREGDLVGLIFDGNIHSLVGDIQYDGAMNRAVAVDVRSIIESLRSVYDAASLIDELTGNRR